MKFSGYTRHGFLRLHITSKSWWFRKKQCSLPTLQSACRGLSGDPSPHCCLYQETTHVPYSHTSLAKACHVVTPNFTLQLDE